MRRGRLSFSADPALTKEASSPVWEAAPLSCFYPMPGSVWLCTVASAWKGGYRPRSYRAGGYAIPFLRSYRGTHPLGRSALSLLRCGERPRGYPDVASGRCTGTLRQRGRERLPGKRGRTRTVPQRGKAVSSEVTSGCPKRSEGGFPVGTRTITVFPSGAKLSTAFSSGTVHPPPSQASPVFPSGN